MADTKISALSAGGTIVGTELVPIVQSANTVRTTPSALKTYVTSTANVFSVAQTFQPTTAATAVTARRGTAGQTEDIVMIQAQDNTLLASFKSDGALDAPAVTGGAMKLAAGGVITDATASRTLSAGDNGKVIYFTSGSAVTVATASGLGAGFSCTLMQGGAGQIEVTQGAGTTRVGASAQYKTAAQYAIVGIICPVADTFVVGGNTAA